MYPVRYEADYVEPQNRAKAFFRWLLIIPWYALGIVYGFVAQVVALIAWFALLFTGRYPQGLYDFNAGFLRFTGRATAFAMLQTEEWPPWGFDPDQKYPVRVPIDPPLQKYSRWKVFFRLIIGIPAMFMLMLFQYLYLAAATIAWIHIVFMGRTSGGIHNALTTGLAYQLRTFGYFLLITETLPPVSDQEPAGIERRGPSPKTLGSGAAAPTAIAEAPAKKPASKSTTSGAAKRSTAAKPAAKKPATKKAPAKKPTAKKAPAKKPAAKKAPPKKPSGGRRPPSGRS